ncbi:lamin tail domain-containing protein [Chitinispirillales bacterium ANBcel5]|uniref:lamin tail domain-containing protein n=1 Tax=Cellulosispirillum alkaliphilum TaxID=3039283 RepID=UPI002A53AB1E|nr:lamin tail domain-containing protein [Chitinispirillales bacterium ANBcel5]
MSCSNVVSEDIEEIKDPEDFIPYHISIDRFMVKQNETKQDPDFGNYSGWIKLYNHEDDAVDIGGWIVSGQPFKSEANGWDTLPKGTLISPKSHLRIWTNGEGVVRNSIHTSFTLSEEGGQIGLYGPRWADTPVMDTISYSSEDVAADIAFGRFIFGDENREPQDFIPHRVTINEFMVKQSQTLKDPDFGDYSGWIELYNHDDGAVDISGWIVSGQPLGSESNQWGVLPRGTVIAPEGYLLIWADGINMVKEGIHTSLTLSEEGGQIGLYGPQWAHTPVMDTISYSSEDVVADISIGRFSFRADHRDFILPMNNPTPGEPNRLRRLELLGSHELAIEDPSGLDVDHTGNYFWTVSDMPGGSIYKIDREGSIVLELQVDGHDMEGISQHPHNRNLYVAEERLRTIVVYDTLGTEIERFKVDVEFQRLNDGLEGITINPFTGNVFVVNKRLPRALIELDLSREEESRERLYAPMNLGAHKDSAGLSLAGLFFDSDKEVLWMISDEARAVFVLDLTGRPLAVFDAFKRDLEAIALLREDEKIYLVSDRLHTLFAFRLPSPLKMLSPRSSVD